MLLGTFTNTQRSGDEREKTTYFNNIDDRGGLFLGMVLQGTQGCRAAEVSFSVKSPGDFDADIAPGCPL